MRTKAIVGVLMTVAMGLAVVPVVAHHAFSAEFDANRPIHFQGTVTKVEWINPHAWIHMDITQDDGSTERWMIEGGQPAQPLPPRLQQRGHHGRDGDRRRWLRVERRDPSRQRPRPDSARRPYPLHGLLGHRRPARRPRRHRTLAVTQNSLG